jgi:hypothetical protein
VKGWERMFELAMSSPARCSKLKRAEPVKVKTKLTMNWIVNLRSFPNMNIETSADKTNIHANEKMKTPRSEFELIKEANAGNEPPKEDATLVRADWVKNW